MNTIRELQARSWENKLAHGFNTTDVPLEFCLLTAEITEAFHAWRTASGNLGSELADIAIFLLGLAQMTGIDLASAITAKITVNQTRTYEPLANGVLARTDSTTAPHPGGTS